MMKIEHGSIFAHATFQFCGHLDEYLICTTDNLTIFRIRSRFGTGGHSLERYEHGQCVERRQLRSSRNIFLYYLLVFFHHNRELWRCARRAKGRTAAIFMHPVACFGMWTHRLFHRVRYIFWVWDWFTPTTIPLKIYAALLRFYIRRVDAPCALTSAIADKLGGNMPVVMLGMRWLPSRNRLSESQRILFVGQLRHGQGIENVLDFIAEHKDYSLSLIGAAANGFEHDILARINDRGIAGQVYFPNRFVSQEELSDEAARCFCGMALYSMDKDNCTHFADPGKIKSYIEMGLPVVMTRISEIVPFVEKFNAGEVIDSISEIPIALERIKDNRSLYEDGARKFACYFEIDSYYRSNLERLFNAQFVDYFSNLLVGAHKK